jgi:hypothetical protein
MSNDLSYQTRLRHLTASAEAADDRGIARVIDQLLALDDGPVRIASGWEDWGLLCELRDLGLITRRNAWFRTTDKGQRLLGNPAGVPGVKFTLAALCEAEVQKRLQALLAPSPRKRRRLSSLPRVPR